MTPKVRQVLDDLAQTPARWRMHRDGSVRAGGHCPLSYLAKTEPCNVEWAANKLQLTYAEAAVLANAADDCGDSVTRAELLRACRLSETA